MIYKTVINYFGYLILKYLPEIKSIDLFKGDEFLDDKNVYPSISIEPKVLNISDIQGDGQMIDMQAILHIYADVRESFDLADNNKDYSGRFLDLSDAVNYVVINYGDQVQKEIPNSIPIQAVRRTNFNLIETDDNIKESVVVFNFRIFDTTMFSEPEYHKLEKFIINGEV